MHNLQIKSKKITVKINTFETQINIIQKQKICFKTDIEVNEINAHKGPVSRRVPKLFLILVLT